MKKIITFIILFIQIPYIYAWDDLNNDLFQDALSENFEKIDTKIINYLNNLNKAKNHCFWKDRSQNFIECVNDIEKNLNIYSDYANEYSNACDIILKDTIDKTIDKSISALDAKKYIDQKTGISLCENIYNLKLQIYKSTAYDILKMNKYNVLKDENKLFIQNQRTKYDKVLDLFRINLWYIERMWKKWPSKTKK